MDIFDCANLQPSHEGLGIAGTAEEMRPQSGIIDMDAIRPDPYSCCVLDPLIAKLFS